MAKGMPIGLCSVCDEPLDLSDAGICKTCGNGFCWGDCGGWAGGEHACTNCAPEGDDDDVDDDREDADDRTCSYCGGDGGDPGNDGVLPCPHCDGQGCQ